MKLAIIIAALLLTSLELSFAQASPRATSGKIVLFSSADAPGVVSADRLNSCLRQIAHDWKQNEKALPTIAVFHVSSKAAQAVGITNQRAVVRRNRSPEQADLYYELWLVDTPKAEEYVLAFENILEDHFQLNPTEDQRKEVMTRAARIQNATISAFEGK